MAKYFILMENDHRKAPNKLSEEFRKRVKEDFNHKLIEDVPNCLEALKSCLEFHQGLFPRCRPLEPYFRDKGIYFAKHKKYYVPSLFNLVFFEVKEGGFNG